MFIMYLITKDGAGSLWMAAWYGDLTVEPSESFWLIPGTWGETVEAVARAGEL